MENDDDDRQRFEAERVRQREATEKGKRLGRTSFSIWLESLGSRLRPKQPARPS